jgi:hypothetical protein
MIDDLRSLVGPEALAGLLIYGAVAYMAAGPISERIAERDHLPLCIKGELASAEDAPETTVVTKEEIGLKIYRETMARLPVGLGDWADQIVKPVEDGIGDANRRRAERFAANAPDRCQCLMVVALSATRTDWALYTGTLKLYAPPAVTRFSNVMATADPNNTCSK